MTTLEPTLFDLPLDPDTQRIKKQAAEVLAQLRYWEGACEGCSAWDLFLHWSGPGVHPPQQNVIASRLNELKRAGLIRDTGEKRQGGYGVAITVWRSV